MDYGVLARSYNTLAYKAQLKSLLIAFYRDRSLESYSKRELHELVNQSLLEHYQGEEILKFKLAQQFKTADYVAAFEVRAKSSRADFLAINGETKCFEIKSKIDTLKRLEKQSSDYKDVFEFNTVVIDKSHLSAVENTIPEYYGIWYFECDIKYEHRVAKVSPYVDPSSQLSLLTKKELMVLFSTCNYNSILSNHCAETINTNFKTALKRRYETRWSFLVENWDKILPIDIQFFYNTNIQPELIYSA